MNALEKAAALDMISEADSMVLNEDEVDIALDTWENESYMEEDEENEVF